jgi:hypothetical protein
VNRPVSTECECRCGCDEPATTTDDGDNHVCEACAEYTVTDDGECYCSRVAGGDGVSCHECYERIDWGGILAGQPGVANWREGSCVCGESAWIDKNLCGWGNYSYQRTS